MRLVVIEWLVVDVVVLFRASVDCCLVAGTVELRVNRTYGGELVGRCRLFNVMLAIACWTSRARGRGRVGCARIKCRAQVNHSQGWRLLLVMAEVHVVHELGRFLMVVVVVVVLVKARQIECLEPQIERLIEFVGVHGCDLMRQLRRVVELCSRAGLAPIANNNLCCSACK